MDNNEEVEIEAYGSPIHEFRNRIDEIDAKILILINKRLELALEIGRHKKENGEPIVDSTRESSIIKRLLALNSGPIDEGQLKKLFLQIIAVSREIQGEDDRTN
jgi:chorismate mutase